MRLLKLVNVILFAAPLSLTLVYLILIYEAAMAWGSYESQQSAIDSLIALDRLGNSLLGGSDRETISSRLGKEEYRCRMCLLICTVLNWVFQEKDHCKISIGI